MLFDTHAHYDDEAFDTDRDALLTALPQRGVGLVLNPGCDVESSRKAVTYAAAYPHVYAAVGIHPENCGGCTADDLAAIRALEEAGELDKLPGKLRETALLRKENPEATLQELAAMLEPPITKSAINHRMRKLLELARALEE